MEVNLEQQMAATINTSPDVDHQVKRLFCNKSQLNSSEQKKVMLMQKLENAEKRKQTEEDKSYGAIVEQQKRQVNKIGSRKKYYVQRYSNYCRCI